MWQSKADFINDLAALNDFGDSGNSEPYAILNSVGRGSKTKIKHHKTFLDTRTGEKIKIDDENHYLEDIPYKGKGRGAVLSDKNYSLLHKQLRLARPLGSGDEIIESYFKKNNSGQEDENPPVEDSFQSTENIKNSPFKIREISSSKARNRVKAVRSSNSLQNALIINLLKGKEISLPSSTSEIKEAKDENTSNGALNKIIVEGNEVPANNFKNGYNFKNKFSHLKSHSDDQLKSSVTEYGTSGSLSNSEDNSDDEVLDVKKELKYEDSKGRSSDSSENFSFDSSFSAGGKNNAFENVNGRRSTSLSVSINQHLERVEMYRKLGESLNKTIMKNKIGYAHLGALSDSDSFESEFVYDETHFPALTKK